jgi:DNA-binding response OmpR family regulator
MDQPNKKILIIEDDEDFLFILKRTFGSEKFFVVSAKNGLEGAEAAEKEKPDLIISDVLMPKMDGFAMAKKVRESGLSMPIVFLTNMDEQERVQEFEYFKKSEIRLDELVKKIKEKLGIKEN